MTKNSRLAYLLVMMLMVIITISLAPPTTAQSLEGPKSLWPIDENPLVRDAQVYASDQGISLDEAIRRLQLQRPIGELNAQLIANERDTFAGLWIQHDPEYRVIVQFTRDSEATIQPYIDNGPLADIVEVRTARVSLAQLEIAQSLVMKAIHDLGVTVNSGINVFENSVELYVIERSQLEAALQEANIQFPEYVKIITVKELSTPEVDIYAGLALSACTSGFSVKNSNGTKGITTAAHCPNSLSYNGTNLPFQGSAYGGSYDVQWHTAPGFTMRNLMYDGIYNRYVYSTKHRNNQALNEFVCKYGKTTGNTCGYIIDKNFDPGADYIATFIRVHRDGVNLSEPGDSGGPWFSGNTAYGIHTHGIGDDAAYMAVNYIDILGLTVLTQ